MKILFTGLPYFGKQLVAELNAFDAKNKYIFCNTYYSKKDQLRFLWHLPTAKKVVSFNGVTSESGSLNWVLRFKKELIMQWHGSDVLTAQENIKSGKFTRKYIDAARSYTDAEWLKAELAIMNIVVSDLHFKHIAISSDESPLCSLNVFTYLAQNKEQFYGADHILRLADEFRDTHFFVAGTDGKLQVQKPNVHYLGWISESEFQTKLNENAIFIRLTQHDGFALSVLRALANGNYVLWNHAITGADYVDNINQLSLQLKKLVTRVQSNALKRNADGINWAKVHLSKENVLRNFIRTLYNHTS